MFLEKLLSSDTEDWAFGPIGDDQQQPLGADKEYFEVRVESMRLEKRRRGFAKFHAAAHSFFSYGHQGLGRVEMQTLTAPTKLQNLDKASLNKVLQLEQVVLGPVPYRGGSLDVEIGLFAVKSDDIGDSFLKFVGQVSEVGGVSFLESAQPVLGLLKSGVDLLLGTDKVSALEIGIAKEMSPPATGKYVVVAEDKRNVDLDKMSLDSKDGRLLLDSKPYRDADYLIFSINSSPTRNDWAEIPDLLKGYNNFVSAISEGEEKAEIALNAFRLSCITTADLLPSDGDKLFAKSKDVFARAFPGGPVADDGKGPRLPSFAELALYN